MGCTTSTKIKDHHKSSLSGFRPIPDRYKSITAVQGAVRAAGLESSNLILGIDFTKSNTWTGLESFGGKSLHDTSGAPNPYQRVIDIIGRTLEDFDDDKLIPAYGFGDSSTGDKQCFPFLPEGQPCYGVDAVLQRYKEVAASVKLAGPTCFAPVIREAIKTVREEKSYHILVIIADGQVTDPRPTGETARAIIEASHYPLSIVVVGVGDGPWDTMEHYDDELPERRFDNFQFVDWNAVQRCGAQTQAAIEARFALAALMEVPEQYAYIKELGLMQETAWPHTMLHSTPLAPALVSSPHFHDTLEPPNNTLEPPNKTNSVGFPAVAPPTYQGSMSSAYLGLVAPAASFA